MEDTGEVRAIPQEIEDLLIQHVPFSELATVNKEYARKIRRMKIDNIKALIPRVGDDDVRIAANQIIRAPHRDDVYLIYADEGNSLGYWVVVAGNKAVLVDEAELKTTPVPIISKYKYSTPDHPFKFTKSVGIELCYKDQAVVMVEREGIRNYIVNEMPLVTEAISEIILEALEEQKDLGDIMTCAWFVANAINMRLYSSSKLHNINQEDVSGEIEAAYNLIAGNIRNVVKQLVVAMSI